VEEGDEIIKARETITTEQLLYRISKEKVIETKYVSPERKEKLLDPERDIISLISKEDIFKHAS
jgi:hypothetical protein